MEYKLKNGMTVVIRKPVVDDAQNLISVMTAVYTETLFLSQNPGEFCTTVEKEREIIENVLNDVDRIWLVAEYQGKIVGECSVEPVRRYQRYRHRVELGFVILKDYCDLGIGGKMMEECIKWCMENEITQMELDVVTTNGRAIAMYKGFGFEIVGIMPNALKYQDGAYADEYKMVKML